MSQISRELDEYISERSQRGKGFRDVIMDKLKRKQVKTVKEEYPELKEGKVIIIPKEDTFLDKIMTFLKTPKKEKEEAEEAAEVIIEKEETQDKEFEKEEMEREREMGQTLIARIMAFFFGKKKVEEEIMEEEKEETFPEEKEEAEKEEEPDVVIKPSNPILDFITNLFRKKERFEEGTEEEMKKKLAPEAEEIIKPMLKFNMKLLHAVSDNKLEQLRKKKEYEEFKEAVKKYKEIAGEEKPEEVKEETETPQ